MARRAASIDDYRAIAKRTLPHFLFEYVDGGSYSEVTLRRNRSDLEAIALRQRILRNVANVETSTELFGQRLSIPVALAPIGLAGMNARRGEVQAAKAACAADVPFTLSTVSACTIQEVAAGCGKPFWFQLYMIRDRAFMKDLLTLAKDAGCSALVFTVDMPVPGSRYRDYRSGLAGAAGPGGALRRFGQAMLRPRWAWDVGVRGRPHTLGNVAPVLKGKTGLEDFFAWMRNNFDASVSWKDLDRIRQDWSGPLLIKGILDVEDAKQAAGAGADGVIVSNHGGRQLDGVLSSARALPAIADAVGQDLAVLADGGIRSGLDVARMIALGARAVMVGRPWVFGLAARGEAGVGHVIELLKAELRVAMSLTGCTSIAQIDRNVLASG